MTQEPAILTLLQDASDMGFERPPVEAMARRFLKEAHGRRSPEQICGELTLALSMHAVSERSWDQIRSEVNDYMNRWLEDEGLDDI